MVGPRNCMIQLNQKTVVGIDYIGINSDFLKTMLIDRVGTHKSEFGQLFTLPKVLKARDTGR